MPQIYDMGPTALLPLRRKACWGFFRPKNPTALARFEPANLGAKGQHATPRPPKPFTHTICTQNQFTFIQHSSHRFHSVFPNEIVMVMIIRDTSAMAKNARPHEESFESEAILPNFHEWTVTCWHGSTLWLTLFHSKALFSEEFAIYHSASNRCVVFWSKENPHFSQELVYAALSMTFRLCAWTVLFQ